MNSSSVVGSRRASPRLYFALLVLPCLGALPATAQTVLSFNTLYEAQDLTPFGNNINFNYSTNFAWEASASFGSFSSGLFGEEYGAGGSAFVRVAAGFNVGFKADTGTVSVKLPNKIRVTSTLTPDDENFGGTIAITQDRSGIGSDSFFTTTAPSFGFNLGFHYELNAGIEGRIAYGFGSSSGEISLATLWAAQSAQNAALYAAGISPYKTNLDKLISFDGATGKAAIFNYEFDVPAAGFAKDISASTITGLNGKTLPTLNRMGRIVINPVTSALSAQSNTSFTTTRTVENVLRGELDMLGIVSSAFGLPINPFDLRAPIAGTPIEVSLKLLSMNPHIGVGVKQTLTLAPNTYLNLTSNHDVTYSYVDSNGQTQTVTTRNMQYLLPNDGSASTLRIVQVPEASNWQLYSSISIAPQIRNQLFLTITEGFDIEALKAQIGAYGFNASIGPLVDEDFETTQAIAIWDQWNALSGGALSRVYRNKVPLYGAGVIQQMANIGVGEDVDFLGAAGNYSLNSIAGSLLVSDLSLLQVQSLDIASTGLLRLQSSYAEDSSEVLANRLTVQTGGRVQIDPNNLVTVTSALPGFVDFDGMMASGTFVLGGALVYNGPDIRRIGAGAEIQLLPSSYETDTEVGYRIRNNDHDGLASLEQIDGKLLVAGQNLAIASASLTNAGTLALTNGSDLITTGSFANTGSLFVGKDSILAANSLGAANLASDTLANFHGTFGTTNSATGSGQLSYATGTKPTTLASTTHLTFIGARPTAANGFAGDGYLTTGTLGSGTDALSNVTANAGTLTLTEGASQSFDGNLTNTGALNLNLSHLAIAGSFGSTGTVNIQNYGSITAGGALVLGAGDTLTGNWTLGGTVTHNGGYIRTIAEGASVDILGAGLGFVNSADEYQNTWEHFSRLDGSLTLRGTHPSNAASLVTNATLSLGANSQLNLEPYTQLSVGALADWSGTLLIGSFAELTTSGLPMDEFGNLTFHELTLYGHLSYVYNPFMPAPVFGIGAGTRVNVRGVGSFGGTAGNGWSSLSSIDGTLDLTGGGSVRTNTSLVIGATGTLLMDANSRLAITQGSFSITPGSNVQLAGTVSLGGGGGGDQTAFAINDGFILDKVRLELGQVSMVDHYANVNGSGKLIGLGTWTNTGNILGRGDISGGTLINRGTIDSAGVYGLGDGLRLHGFAAPIQNYGTLGSLQVSSTDASLRTTMHFDGVTVDNLTLNDVTGSLAFHSDALFSNATINNGAINVNSTGAIVTENSNLNVDYFTVDGAMLVRNNSATTARGQFIIGYTGSLTLQGATDEQIILSLDENNNPTYGTVHRTPTSLNFAAGSTLSNRGLLTLESGTTLSGVSVDNYGRARFAGTNTFQNFNNLGGVVDLLDGSSISLSGTFNNLGLLHLAGENPTELANSHATLLLTGNTTLTGTGTLQLGGYIPVLPNYPAGIAPGDVTWANAGTGTVTAPAASGYTLTVGNQSIFGRGNLGGGNLAIDILAGGRVAAQGSGSTLTVDTTATGLRNRGTLEAGNGATLHVTGGAFQSLDTTTQTLTEGALVVAGTMKIDALNAAQPLHVASAVTFDGSNGGATSLIDGSNQTVGIGNVLTGGMLTAINTTYTLDAASRAFSNLGTLRTGTGGTLAITGSNFTNFSGTTLTDGSYDSTGTIRFANANIVTNAADVTLRNTGRLVDATDQNALRNFSTNLGRFALFSGATHAVGAHITTFTQGGNLIVGAGSTFDFGAAAITNQNAANYWVSGSLRGTNSPLANGAAHLTLYGNAATWLTGTDTFLGTVGTGSTLTLAGGKEAYFAPGTTLNNTGVIEIGSAATRLADGSTIRSSGYARFGTFGDPAYANIAGGTLRYYSGPTDDTTTVTNAFDGGTYRGFLVDRLGMFGTLDANGAITFGSAGKLDIYGMLTNSLSATSFINNSGDDYRGTLKIVGGIDLPFGINAGNIFVNYTHSDGATLRLAGAPLTVDTFSISSANSGVIDLRDGAGIVDRSGVDQLRTLRTNSGTMTFARSSPTAALNDHTFVSGFDNSGTITLSENSWFRVTGGSVWNTGTITLDQSNFTASSDFTNTGTITGSNSSNVTSGAGGFTNRGTVTGTHVATAGDFLNRTGATFNGSTAAGGDLTNETGATFTGGGSAQGTLRNQGTMDLTYFTNITTSPYTIGVYNSGTLTFRGSTIENAIWVPQVGSTPAHYDRSPGFIHNTGTATFYGLVDESLSGNGTFRINDPDGLAFDTRLSGSNYIQGPIFVDAGRLHLTGNDDLGGNPLNPALVTVATGAALQLDNLTLPNSVTLQDDALLQAGSTGSSIGQLTLTGGTPTISGKLTVSGGGGLGGLNLANGFLASDGIISLQGALTGTGGVQVGGTGHYLALDGGSTLAGLITIDRGAYLSFRGQFDSNAHVTGPIMHIGSSAVTTTTTANSVISGTAEAQLYGDVIFAGNHTYTGLTTINSGATLTLGHGFTTGSLAGDILNLGSLTFNRSSNFTIGAGNSISGSGAITQAGSGIMTVAHASFLNSLTVAHGSVLIDGTSLGASGTLPTVTNQSKLGFAHSNTASNYTATVNGTGNFYNYSAGQLGLTLTGGAGRLYHHGSGTLTLSGVNAIAGGITIGNYSAISGGPSTVNYTNPGTLVLAGESNFSSAPATYVADWITLHDGGTLKFSNGTTLAATRGVTVTDGVIDVGALNTVAIPSLLNGSGFTTSSLTKTGAGTLAVFAPTTAFDFAVNAGTLSLDNQGANRFPHSLSVAEDATARFTGTGTTQVALFGGTTAGNLTVEDGQLSLDGSVTNANGTATITVGSGATLYTFAAGALTYDRILGAGTYDSSNQATSTQIGSLHVGTFNANRFALAIDSLQVSGTTTVANGVGLTLGDGFTGTLTYGTSNPLTVTGEFIINSALNSLSQLTKAGAGTLALGFGGTINNLLKVDAGTLRFAQNSVYTSTISGDGAVEITDPSLSSAPAVTFTRDQTYTGGTTVARGQLILGNGGSTGSVLGNVHLTHSGLSGLVFNRSGETTLTNSLTGYGWIGQASTGTLVINRDLTFTNDEVPSITPFDDQRDFRVTGGTLRLDDGAAGIGDVTLSADTTLLLNNATAELSVDGNLTGAGDVIKQAAGHATLAGTNTHTGTTEVNTGTLTLTGANTNAGGTTVGQNSGTDTATLALTGTATLAGNVSNRATGTVSLSDTAMLTGLLANDGVLSLNRDGNYTLALTPTGTGEIVQNGAGDLLLGSAAHTNRLRINSGRVGLTYNTDLTLASQLGGAGRFYHTGTTLRLTGGTFTSLGGIDVDVGSIVRLEGGAVYDTDFALAPIARLVTALDLYYDRNITGPGLVTIESGTFALTGGSIDLGAGLLTVANGATLALSGNSTVTATVTNHGLIDFNNESNYVFSSAVGGTGAFLVNSSGRVELTAANTATGGATVTSGSTLALSGAGAVGGTIANTGTVEIVSNLTTPRTVPTNISGNGAVLLSGGGDIVFSSSPVYSGETLLADGTTMKVGTLGTATFANAITGYGNLHTGHQGTTVITGNAAFGYDSATGLGGQVTVGGGSTLQIGNGGTSGTLFAGNGIVVNGTLAFNFANNHQAQLGNFSGLGTVRVMDTAPTSDHGATLLVATDNAGFSGTMQIDAGATLQLGNGGTTGSIFRDGLSLAQNGTFAVDGTLRIDRSDDFDFNYNLTGASTGTVQDLNGNLTVTGRLAFDGLVQTGGHLTFNSTATDAAIGRFAAATASNSGWLTLTGDTDFHGKTFTNSGVLTLGNGAGGSFLGTIANAGTLIVNRDTTVRLGALGANHDVTGNGDIIQDGTGTLVIDQIVTARGFYANHGTLEFDHNYAGSSTGTVDGGADATVRFIEGTFDYTINAAHLATLGTVTLNHVASLGNVAAHLAGASGSLTLARDGTATDLTIGGTFSGDADVHFTDTGKLTIAGGSTNTGALTTVGHAISVGGELAASRVDFLTAGTNTLAFTNPTNASFGGLVTGVTTLQKSGAGSLVFTGTFGDHSTASVNVGSAITLDVAGGTLDVSNATLNRDLHLLLANTGTLDIGNRGSSVLSLNGTGGTLVGSGNLTVDQIFYRGALSGFNQLTTQGGELGALTGINSLIKNYTATGNNSLSILGDASGSGIVKINAGDVSFEGTATFGGYLDVNTTGNPGGFTSVTFREHASFGNGVFGDVVINDADVSFLKNATADYFVVNNRGELRIGGLATATDSAITSFSISGNSYLRFGADASLAAGNDIFLDSSTLTAEGTLTFAADQTLAAYGSTLRGSFVFHSVIAGSAADALNFDGGRLTLAGSSAYVGRLNIHSGTLVLGNLAAIDLARTNFSAGTAFDVNGTNWSASLLNFNQVTVANSAASAVVLSSTIGTNSWFGLDGGSAGLAFSGAIAGSTPVGVRTSGNVTLDAATFAQISSLTVQSGTTQVSLAAFANPTTVELTGTGTLDLTAPATGTFTNSLAFHASGVTGDSATLLNNTGAALTISSSIATSDDARLATALIGGDHDTMFTGTLSGEGSLTKIGTGTLTFTPANVAAWNATRAGARLGVREGTLITNLATLTNRRLVIEDTGTLQLTDSAANTLQIAALDGNGTLDLGSRSVEFRGQNYVTGNPVTDFTGNVGAFTGTLTTTGNVTFNDPTGLTFGPKYLEQSFGTLNASTLTVNVGSITVLDALNVGSIYFGGGGTAGGIFRSTVNGISNAALTDLTGQFYRIVGRVSLIGGAGLTSHSGNLSFEAAGAEVVDDASGRSIFDFISTNTGAISALGVPGNGVTIHAGVSAFTNQSTGTISLSNSEWVSAGAFTNRGSLTLTNSALSATSLQQNAGTLAASGTLAAPLTVNGGAFEIGGNGTAATLNVQGRVALNAGSLTRWEFSPLDGTATAASTDLLAVSNTAGHTDGTLTFGTATTKQPVIVQLDASSFPYDANFTQSRTWTFATTTDGVSGFDASTTLVRPRPGFNLANAVNGQGNFGLQVDGNNVNVVYDPSTVIAVASGGTTLDTPIGPSGTYGLAGLTKTGSGILTINAANTYTGMTQMLGGTLEIGHNSALGSGAVLWNAGTIRSDATARTLANTVYLQGNLTVGGATNLTFTGSMTNVADTNRTLTINNTGLTTFGDIVITGSPTSNAATPALTFNVAATSTAIVAGAITDGLRGSALNKNTGTGTLALTGTNTYSGLTTINSGTLQLGHGGTTGSIAGDVLVGANGTLAFNRSNAATFTGAISGAGKVTQVGAGVTTLAGGNSYTGITTVQSGTLQFAKTAALYQGNASSWTADNLVVQSGATAAFNVGGAGEFSASDLAVIASLGTATGGFKSGAILGLDTTNAAGGVFTYGGNLTDLNGGANALGLAKLGTGTLSLTGANTYSGTTFVHAGTLRLGSATALSANTTLNVATGATFDTNGYALALATLAGTGTVNVGGAGLTVAPTATNTYAGTLTGTGGLTMNGTGTLVLNNASNSFSGPVSVQSGTLEVGATGALPSGLAVSLSNTATLNLANNSTTVGALTGNGQVTLGTATLTLAPTGGRTTFAGAISGAGGVTVSGGGTVVLSGTSSYTGDTTVNAGTLVVNGSNATSDLTVGTGGTLGGSGTVGDLFLGAGSTLAPGNSPGTLHVAGNSTWSGGAAYNWQIVDAAGLAGTGYDLVSISGALTIAATSNNRYVINLLSLLANDTAGNAINFNHAVDSSYTIASATGGVIGFNANAFTLNTTGFTNDLGVGTWSISSNGYQVSVNFAAIPEPSTYALLLGGAVLALAAWRRRRR